MERNAKDNNRNHEVDPDRMIDAADLLLVAEAQHPSGMGLVEVLEQSQHDSQGRHFTASELIEAMGFLIRAGLVTPRDAGAARRADGRRHR